MPERNCPRDSSCSNLFKLAQTWISGPVAIHSQDAFRKNYLLWLTQYTKMKALAPADLEVATLGPRTIQSPMQRHWAQAGEMEIFVSDEDRILLDDSLAGVSGALAGIEQLPAFELAGPRRSIFFDPAQTSCAIVTCGGLCPGINDVIRGLTMEAYSRYGVQKIYGIRCGYEGLIKNYGHLVLAVTEHCAEQTILPLNRSDAITQ
jgi:hypothetical protein